MADTGDGRDFHLTQAELDAAAEFETAAEVRTRRRRGVRHGGRFWCTLLVIVVVVIVGLIVLYPRKAPCREQIIFESTAGTSATLERCAPAGQHGGIFGGAP
jgi:hypothetical protein